MLIRKAGVRLLDNNAIHVKVPDAALQNPRTLKPIIESKSTLVKPSLNSMTTQDTLCEDPMATQVVFLIKINKEGRSRETLAP